MRIFRAFAAKIAISALLVCAPLHVRAATLNAMTVTYTYTWASWFDCALWTGAMLIGDMTGNSLGAAAAQNQLIQSGCSW